MSNEKPVRADWKRSRERILSAANEMVGRDGAQVSLEAVARLAGVGSATLHRHFPSRQSLLEVVFRGSVAQLCQSAAASPGDDPGRELIGWLEELTERSTTIRGLTMALLVSPGGGLPLDELCSRDLLNQAADGLVSRAKQAGELRADATTNDLLTLTTAISAATENDYATARRLLHLAIDGLRPR